MPSRAVLVGVRVSPFVEKVARALMLKRIAFEEVHPRSYWEAARWNPQTGKVPVLEINEERLYDSTLILRRLDELVPEPPLVADDSTRAAAQRLLEDWSDEALYWYGMALRWNARHAAATARQLAAFAAPWLRPLAPLVLPRRKRAATIAQGLGRLPEAILLGELAACLDSLVAVLSNAPFFYDTRPSVADLAVFGQFSMLRSGPTPEAAALIEERSALMGWIRRIEARTSP